jgi:predicted nucleic acid-binding protein
MVKALFDTNILIDHLNGVEAARDEIDRYEDGAISIVTWIEVMVGAEASNVRQTRAFLSAFAVVPLDKMTAEITVSVRQAARLRLPDAIIWACAKRDGRLLVTRNTRDFPADDPGVREPYRL